MTMEELTPALSALSLGLLTALHPCPLASHLGALAILCGWTAQARKVRWAGLCLATGFGLGYAVLGALLALGLAHLPSVAQVLPQHLNRVLGPLLILTGMLFCGLFGPWRPSGYRSHFQEWLRGRDLPPAAAIPVGVLLALCFCPASAALFFGTLVPLALTNGAPLLFPALYGLGASLPLGLTALGAAQGLGWAEGSGPLGRFARWLRPLAGMALIGVGVGHTLRHVWNLW